jgi:transcriptional regulator with XRE-family HTH domain
MPAMVDSMFSTGYPQVVAAIVAMRKKAGLTQRQLADALGREQNLVGRIETGQRRVDIVELVWICRACSVEPEEQVTQLVRKLAGMGNPRKLRR